MDIDLTRQFKKLTFIIYYFLKEKIILFFLLKMFKKFKFTKFKILC